MNLIRRLASSLAAPWRRRCRLCGDPLAPADVFVCAACMTAESDAIFRRRLGELDAHEALALARGIALRDGEKDLAAALQAVLLLHLTGGSLASITALVEQSGQKGSGVAREAVN